MKPEINKTVEIEIPISVFSALKQTPEEFAISMRIAAVVLWYQQGMVSQETASEIAGLFQEDFIMALKEFNVSPFQESTKEISTNDGQFNRFRGIATEKLSSDEIMSLTRDNRLSY